MPPSHHTTVLPTRSLPCVHSVFSPRFPVFNFPTISRCRQLFRPAGQPPQIFRHACRQVHPSPAFRPLSASPRHVCTAHPPFSCSLADRSAYPQTAHGCNGRLALPPSPVRPAAFFFLFSFFAFLPCNFLLSAACLPASLRFQEVKNLWPAGSALPLTASNPAASRRAVSGRPATLATGVCPKLSGRFKQSRRPPVCPSLSPMLTSCLV